MLNPSAPTPLYHQLAEMLQSEIDAGRYAVGKKIPSEHELAQRFQIGRPTVRQATELLVRRNRLERRRGSGTFVRQTPQRVDLFSLGGTAASFHKQGLSLETRLLSNVTKVKSEGLEGKSAWRVIRLGSVANRISTDRGSASRATANGVSDNRASASSAAASTATSLPVVLETLDFDCERFSGIKAHLKRPGSLSRLVEERYQLRANKALQSFHVGKPSTDEAKALQISERKCVLFVERRLHFEGAGHLVHSRLCCRTDTMNFSQEIIAND